MQYNNRYQKLNGESVDTQYFSLSYLDGMTASEWVERAKRMNLDGQSTNRQDKQDEQNNASSVANRKECFQPVNLNPPSRVSL